MSGVTFLRKARLPSSWMCSSIRQKDDSSSFAFVGSITFRKLDFLGSLGLYECNEVYNATLLWTKLQMYKSPFSAYCILQTIAYIIWKAATICLFYEKNIFFRKLTFSLDWILMCIQFAMKEKFCWCMQNLFNNYWF